MTHHRSGIEAVYLYGAEVVPGSTYEIRTATAACIALGDESCLSRAVTVITTPKWCDVAFPMGGAGQPNFGDISAVVGAFQGQATSPGEARAMVQPREPNPASAVSFSDISATVAAFQTGGVYPYAGPDVCP